MYLVIGSSILGNFFAGWLARLIGYRATIVGMFLAYFCAMFGAYYVPRDHLALLCWFPLIGFCQGAFALFTMYLPPLVPHAAAHDRRGLLLQHRAHHRRLRHGLLWPVLQGGRPPHRPVLRRVPLPAGGLASPCSCRAGVIKR